jgi:hypothetical protein
MAWRMDVYFREEDALMVRLAAEWEARHPAFYAEMRDRFARLRIAQQVPRTSAAS